MNLRLYFICIATVLALVGPALADSTSTVHGSVYGWDTFEPLENAVVEVNSTPSQSMVAKYGLYSFDLVPGDYKITARYYQNSTLTYSAEETIKIENQGNYVLDLLLLPVYSDELMDSSGVNEFSENANRTTGNLSSNTTNLLTKTSTDSTASKNNSSNINLVDQSGIGPINVNYLLVTLSLILLLAAGYLISRKDKKIEKVEKNQPLKKVHRISGTEAVGKGHSTGDLFKPVKVSELSVEVHDERVEVPNESLEPALKSQVQESQIKPFETASSTESVADPVEEPVRDGT